MKKIFFLIVLSFIFATSCAGPDKPIAVSQLPAAAQTFIKTHFPSAKVSYASIDKSFSPEFSSTEYEVHFANGNQIEFDEKGQWKEVKCVMGKVPAKIIPANINKYISEYFSEIDIIKIQKKRRGYEVELRNEIELEFDLNGNFVKMDD